MTFAFKAGMLVIYWLSKGHGYEITGMGVFNAYSTTMKAAEKRGSFETNLVLSQAIGRLFYKILEKEFLKMR